MDKTTKQIKSDMTKQQDYLGPCQYVTYYWFTYIYIINQSHIFNAYRCN